MNRREFTALIGAGAIFPTELIKGVPDEEKPSKSRKLGETVFVYRLGSGNTTAEKSTPLHPERGIFAATDSDVRNYYRQIDIAGAISIDLPVPNPTIPYERWFGPAKDLVLAFGSVGEETANPFRQQAAVQLAHQWGRMSLYLASGYPIVTQFPVVSYYLPEGTIDTPIFVYHSDIDKKPMRCGTITSPGHKCGASVWPGLRVCSDVGSRYFFAGYELTCRGYLK